MLGMAVPPAAPITPGCGGTSKSHDQHSRNAGDTPLAQFHVSHDRRIYVSMFGACRRKSLSDVAGSETRHLAQSIAVFYV